MSKDVKKNNRKIFIKQLGLIGLGFGLGSVLGNLVVRLLFFEIAFKLLLSLVPDHQMLVRLLAALGLLLLGLFLGGFAIGGVGGWGLGKTVGEKKSKGYWWKTGLAFGLTQMLLIVPMVLVVAVMSQYNNNVDREPENFMLLFGIFGIIYGLIVSLVMGLLTVGRHFWRVIGRAVLGFGIGGAVLGLGLWWIYLPTAQGASLGSWEAVKAIIFLAGFNVLGGVGLGGYYLSSINTDLKKLKLSKSWKRFWKIVLLAGLLIVGLWIFTFWEDAVDFLWVRPASLSKQLSLKSEGSHWSEPNEIGLVNAPIQSGEEEELVWGDRVFECNEKDGLKEVGVEDEKVISSIACVGGVQVVEDSAGKIHVIWLSDGVEMASGEKRQGIYLVESILINDWTAPYIISSASESANPKVRSINDKLVLSWFDENEEGSWMEMESEYVSYSCTRDDLSDWGKTIYDAVGKGSFWKDEELPYCGNDYQRLIYTPNPREEYSAYKPTENAGFDTVAAIAEQTKYELLFTTMEWQADVDASNPDNPGTVLAQAVVELHQRLKENPKNYPKGLTVRILLGNYPEVSNLAWGDQIWNVMEDLEGAGLDEFENEELGWKVEMANYDGTWPHAHAKMLVVDGKHMMAAGFNYGYLHFPIQHSSGQGYDMEDLGMLVTGPVAQMGMSVFDDMWEGSDELVCDDFYSWSEKLWAGGCNEVKASVTHVPEVLRVNESESQSEAYSMFRNEIMKEGDEVIAKAISQAEESLDIFEVNFSMKALCDLAVLFPDVCSYEMRLPFMDAMIAAAERGVEVRVLVERSNMNGVENLIGITMLREELKRRGLEELVTFKFFNGKMHAKAVLIDDELVIIGSQNFHYSAWGESGLVEYSLGTNDAAAVSDFDNLFEYHWGKGEVVEGKEQLTSTP